MKIKEHMNMKDDQYIFDNNDIGDDDKNLISLVSEFLHRWKLLKRSNYWKKENNCFDDNVMIRPYTRGNKYVDDTLF